MLTLLDSLKAEVNGTTLAYHEAGDGGPVVLVHGSVSDQRTWSRQYDVLSRRFRTIVYSRRYARPNAAIADGQDDPLDTHVADLAALIADRDAAPAHVVGHSLGGLIALFLAIRHPGLVRGLVLVEPPVMTLFVDMPPRPTQILGLLRRDPGTALAILRLGMTAMVPATRAFRRGNDNAAIAALGRGILGRDSFHALTPDRRQQVWENRAPDRAQLLHGGYPRLSPDDVRNVRVPVLLVTGQRSPRVFHRLTDHLAALLPDATRADIPGASHIVHEDAPDAFDERVLAFLSGKR